MLESAEVTCLSPARCGGSRRRTTTQVGCSTCCSWSYGGGTLSGRRVCGEFCRPELWHGQLVDVIVTLDGVDVDEDGVPPALRLRAVIP